MFVQRFTVRKLGQKRGVWPRFRVIGNGGRPLYRITLFSYMPGKLCIYPGSQHGFFCSFFRLFAA
ncbi:hypothetical protein HMPREF3213_01563 [Heyndrickxia coagulans]|uniref:Uncharacterized protein n=1 Tax=Heyndrickxia coagulans TaxID=1398 RepID=A0A133KT91_HEYCO|nr:hypothetical protein HMPREF3213_01563 [Heyndrickxia coagulans]